MGVLAIDPGVKKSGFAYADRLRISLQPLDGFRSNGNEESLLRHVEELVHERDVSRILVGLPIHMDGRVGERAMDVLRLIEVLRERFPTLEVSGYDERLTTKEAESQLREHGYRGKDIMTRKDSWSALVLLEDWVNSGEPRGEG